MSLVSRHIDSAFAIFIFGGSILTTIASVFVGISFISYVAGCAAIGSLFYVIYRVSDDWNPPQFHQSLTKAVDVGIFLGIGWMTALTRTAPGVSDTFYWVTASVFVILVLRVLLAPSRIALVQILLFAMVIRLALWFSAPVIKHDPRKHVGITAYIIETGHLLSSPEYYYRDFPASHTISAAMALITSFKPRQAYFAAISLPAILSIIAVAAYTRRLASSQRPLRPALLAATLMTISAAHISRTGFPIPQTLALGMISIALFSALLPEDKRLIALLFLLIGPLLVTHNSAVLSLSILILFLFISKMFTSCLRILGREWVERVPQNPIAATIVLVTGIASVEYLHRIDYFHTQVNRVLTVFFLPSTENAATDISGASFGGSAYTLADPVIHIGIGLFITSIGLVFAIHLMVGELTQGRFREGNAIWTLSAIGLFGVIGVGILLAGTGVITRIRPESSLIMVPVIAIAYDKLGRRRAGAIVVCLVLIATPALAIVAAEESYRNPLTSPTNRAPDDYPNHMSSNEVSALRFAEIYSDSLISGGYVTTTAKFRDVPGGSISIERSLSRRHMTHDDLSVCGSPVLYRTSYQHYPGVRRPVTMNTIYDSGGASLIQCT